MEDPDSVAIANVLILYLLAGLVQLESNFILALLGEHPRIKNRVGDKIETHLMHLQPLLVLDS